MNILVIGGGTSDEREVSIRSAAAVREALTDLGHTVSYIDSFTSSTNYIVSVAKKNALVFPILHGRGGEDGRLQQLFEDAGVRYLGSTPIACQQTFDKVRFKNILRENNLPTPKSEVVDEKAFSESRLTNKPFVLKPISGGSSIDTFIARKLPHDSMAMTPAFKKYGHMLLEELIEGDEITVGILGNTALPVIEIIPPMGGEFDYENKYNGATSELCPPQNVSEDLQAQAQDLALKIHQLTDCRHLSRTDFMINKQGNLFAIDCNTIPGLTTQSLFPKAAKTAGLSWNQLVGKFIELATT